MPASLAFSDNLRDRSTFSPKDSSLPPTSPPLPSSDAPAEKKPKKHQKLSKENLAFLNSLVASFPELSFKPGKKFLFRPKKTVFYAEENKNFPLLLLHETAHALLGHFSFSTELERLTIERDAWEKTRSLCADFALPFDEEFAEANLDTYRDWLHQKTLCKTCGLTCLEVDSESLYCPFCQKRFPR